MIVRTRSLAGFAILQVIFLVGVEAETVLLAYGCDRRNMLLNRIIVSQYVWPLGKNNYFCMFVPDS